MSLIRRKPLLSPDDPGLRCVARPCPSGYHLPQRLTGALGGNHIIHLSLWTEVGVATTTNYTYGNANELKTVGAATYTTDKNGSETSGSGRTSTYDAKNNATSIKLGTTTTAMTYADSNQTERTTKGTTSYAYDVLGMAREKTGTSPAAWYLIDERGAPLAQKDASGKKAYFITDHLGSVVALADSTGTIKRYIYGPYGENAFTSPETIDTPWRFAQGYRDSQTGLTKLGTRYYDPDLARFTQMDPLFGDITDPISLNRWQYANGSPVNFADPSGEIVIGLAIVAGVVIFGLVAPSIGAIAASVDENPELAAATYPYIAWEYQVHYGGPPGAPYRLPPPHYYPLYRVFP